MKRKTVLALLTIICSAVLLCACAYTQNSESNETASETASSSKSSASEKNGTSAEPVSNAPKTNTVTLIPEDTNYDGDDESEDSSSSSDESNGSAYTDAEDISNDSSVETDSVEADDIIGREGNWATAIESVNIRDAAHMGNVVGEIEKGTTVKVLEVDGSWYRIDYEGQTGWVYSEYFD